MSIAAIVKFKNRKYAIRKAVNDINYPYIFWDFKREQFVRSRSVDTDASFREAKTHFNRKMDIGELVE